MQSTIEDNKASFKLTMNWYEKSTFEKEAIASHFKVYFTVCADMSLKHSQISHLAGMS
jgi:hypothetical protein